MPICGSATRARRTPTTWIPATTPSGCARLSTPCSRTRIHRARPPIPSGVRSSGNNPADILRFASGVGGAREPVTDRRRLVRVPASSANLGPGYDVLAAALDIHLELEVSEAGGFEVDP